MSRNHFRHPAYETVDRRNAEAFREECREAMRRQALLRRRLEGRRVLPALDGRRS